ncbi:hypothetical protein ANN_20118 [Periplaneta americana]|uniref:Uncharacterized protein n=1 Tax=Periplaneta americana TaxID=6978 RepID=A0ABQ8SCT7_PERAM|nr:hypothetical protein ANN_20118 [Periplaneta americana]
MSPGSSAESYPSFALNGSRENPGKNLNQVVVITEDVQNVHLLLEYRPHIDVSLTCKHDPKLQEYCVCPQNLPQFDSEGIPNQAPETNKPMILNGPTSRNREGSDQVSVEAKQLGHLYLSIDQDRVRRSMRHRCECHSELQEALGDTALEHPPYSPDLSPCDFDLIPQLKKLLCGKWFANREDILTVFRREVVHIDIDSQCHSTPASSLVKRWKPWRIILKGISSREGPRPTSQLLASRPHAEAEVDDHPTRMEVLCG